MTKTPIIQGYTGGSQYWGWLGGKYREFDTDDAYLEIAREEEDPED